MRLQRQENAHCGGPRAIQQGAGQLWCALFQRPARRTQPMNKTKFIMSKNSLLNAALTSAAFIMSYVLLSFYTEGDQIHYKRLYEAFEAAYFWEVMDLGVLHVSSAEPITLYILWVGAVWGIDKNVYISIFNSILVFGLLVLLARKKAPLYIYLLLLTNFYLIVLLTGAERLKFAYIFFVFAAISTSTFGRFGNIALAPFSHFQALIYFPSLILYYLYYDLKLFLRYYLTVKLLIVIVLFAVFVAVVSLFKFDEILAKAIIYISENAQITEAVNLLILLIVALSATKNRLRMFLVLLPLFPAVVLLGGERVNMIAVSLVIYYLLIEERLNRPLPILLLCYFSIQSIFFISNIIQFGDGFYGLSSHKPYTPSLIRIS